MDFRYWFLSALVITFLHWFNVGTTPSPKEIILTGDWLYKTGDNKYWANSAATDSDWPFIRVPATWESQGYPDYDGVAWYRKHVQIPSDWQTADGIYFDIGKIDDEDEIYVNGRLIGASSGWSTWRKYSVPMDVIIFGQDNLIAVRVNDTGGAGGLWEGPVKLRTGIITRASVEEY